MAQLDRLSIKSSIEESEVQFTNALKPGSGVEGGGLEPGEIVVRRGTGFLELWGLDKDDIPTKIKADLGGVVIPWNGPAELAASNLGQLGDVDYADGTFNSELGIEEAGWVLTWDGLKWVVRPQAGQEEYDGLIPTLNDVGDVDYGFFATAANPKYSPDQGDVLLYEYDIIENKYFWAPVALAFESLQNVDVYGGTININRGQYGRLQFGVPGGGANQSGITFGATQYKINPDGGSAYISQNQTEATIFGSEGLLIQGPVIQGEDYTTPGIRLDENNYDPNLPSGFYYTTLNHVNNNWVTHTLNELADVDTTNVVNGSVLLYNEPLSRWEVGPGPAPDLTAASINELADVNTSTRTERSVLQWDSIQLAWVPGFPITFDVRFDYFDFFGTVNFTGPPVFAVPGAVDNSSMCLPCNVNQLGRVTTVGNVPYICLRTRSSASQISGNTTYGYVRLLHDGFNRAENGTYPSDENRQQAQYRGRTDPLAPVAYGGNLGDLANVSTADVFAGASPVWSPALGQFIMGYPALDLTAYSIGQLGDVDVTGAGTGYGLLWDGSQWYASSLDQRFKLDDMQDVQFGDLGVSNNKLVAAYQLIANPQTSEYLAGQDVSTVLAVSTAKSDAALGSTRQFPSPDAYLYTDARYFGIDFNWTLAQKLDNYVRWQHEPSWHTIDGDGCIELFFYCDLLLENRAILKKNASAGQGGYYLRLNQDGSLQWTVTAPTGQAGFTLNSVENFVSLNNWHHVAATKDGLVHRLYLDGELVDQTVADVSYTGDGQFVLGRNDLDDNNTLTHNFWRGYLLDLRVTRGRPKYTENNYTIPFSLGAEIIDTTPNAGDFLSYDGTKWTNVDGVSADITGNSIDELADVDTTSNNPVSGDALVWTGTGWQPGIPGIGAAWQLEDFTDVSTSYQGGTPWVRLDQAEILFFSELNHNPEDSGWLQFLPNTGMRLAYYDSSYTCDPNVPNNDGTYADSSYSYIDVYRTGQVGVRAERMNISNRFVDCSIAGLTYHEDVLHYTHVPDRGSSNLEGDIPGQVPETYVPCWGVIEDHFRELLPFGLLADLGDVSSIAPTSGQALIWDGSEWKPSSDIAADVSNNSITDLADVNTAGVQLDDILRWDGGNWVATPQLVSIFGFEDVSFSTVTADTPIDGANIGGTVRTSYDQDFTGGSQAPAPNDNLIIDFADDAPTGDVIGARGVAFDAVFQDENNGSSGRSKFYLYGGKGQHHPVLLTSGGSNFNRSFLEVGTTHIRIADNGGINCGVDGFRLADGWRIVYENGQWDWDDFAASEVPNKRGIQTYVSQGLQNLDLSPNVLDDLGNVDTATKAAGQALMWDGANWIASDSVAANISQSSIGGLIDVTKQGNTDLATNDGWISFDVGQLQTSRPYNPGGGLELISSNSLGLIGWSPTEAGAPYLRSTIGPYGTSSLTVEGDQVTVDAVNGVVMATPPALGNNTLPTWLQVKQQIQREAVDYQALFLLGCEDFTETVYNWPIDQQVTTLPNPVYESKFEGSSSIRFSRVSQDKLVWTTANGCPYEWQSTLIWSVEFLIKIDSTTVSDNYGPEFIIAPESAGLTSLYLWLNGNQRNQINLTIGNKNSTQNLDSQLSATLPYDQWVHVYVAHEGGNNVRLYVDGALIGTRIQTSAWFMNGGLSIGGQAQADPTSTNSYLSAQLDDVRIIRGWLPYPENAGQVAVPVEPLPAGDNAFVFGKITQLEDVNTLLNPPVNGDALIWDAVNGYWAPGTAPAADISSSFIGGLADVTTDNSVPDDGDILVWSAINGDWRRTKVDGNGGVPPLNARTVVPGQVPAAGSLFAGEIYINMADRKAFTLDDQGNAFEFATGDVLGTITEIDAGTF